MTRLHSEKKEESIPVADLRTGREETAPRLGIEMMLAPNRMAVKGTQRVSRGLIGNELAMTMAGAEPAAVTPGCLACTSLGAGDFTETGNIVQGPG